MSQDYYKIVVSPENIKSDLSVVDYNGTPVGVYSAMTQVVSSGTGGSSLMTQLSFPILLIILFFIFRNSIMHKVIEEKSTYYKEKKHAILQFGDIHFDGISGIEANNFTLSPIDGDTLISIQKFYLHVRLFPLFLGHLRIDELEVEKMKLRVLKSDSINNYSFIIKNIL